jgi:AcrR family transcriptional regulator
MTGATAPDPATLTMKGRATRSRLLDAARRQLADGGNVDIAGVARAAGVAPSVLYRYFGNKDGLVTAVVDDFYDQYDDEVFHARLAPGGTWMEREALRVHREVAFLYDHPLGRAIAAGLLHEPAATRADVERQRRHARSATSNIRRGQEDGELPPDVDAGLAGAAIIGALRAVLAEALGRTPPPAREDVAAGIVALGATVLAGPGEAHQRRPTGAARARTRR